MLVKQIIRNIVKRQLKHLRGIYKTYLRGATPCVQDGFWDDVAFRHPLKSDRDTITNVSRLTSAYHYATTEAAVVLALDLANFRDAKYLLDLGSGTGHWTDYFLRIFPKIDRIDACDIAGKSCDFLRKRFEGETRVNIHQCSAEFFPEGHSYDLVCMIGSAFHVVQTKQMEQLLSRLSVSLRPGGVLILNDLLPMISHGNQFSTTGQYFKYVRSRRQWRKLASAVHLNVFFVRNYAWISAPLRTSRPTIPEGHIVCIQKSFRD